MPALIVHYLYAKDVESTLPPDTLSSEEETLAFRLGAQGPDPYFVRYRGIIQNDRTCHKFAHNMHAEYMTKALTCLRDNIKTLPQDEQRIGRAFALGMLAHYLTDSAAHPFIYAEEYALQHADPSLADTGSEIHAVIEADLDSWLLWEKEQEDASSGDASLRALEHTRRITDAAGALLSQVAFEVFDLNVEPTQYASAIKDYHHIYNTLEPSGNMVEQAYSGIEGVFRDHSMLQALCHPSIKTQECTSANTAHHTWKDPNTGKESTDSFGQVYQTAVDMFPEAAQAFLAGEDLTEVTHHINYNGIHLNDEETEPARH